MRQIVRLDRDCPVCRFDGDPLPPCGANLTLDVRGERAHVHPVHHTVGEDKGITLDQPVRGEHPEDDASGLAALDLPDFSPAPLAAGVVVALDATNRQRLADGRDAIDITLRIGVVDDLYLQVPIGEVEPGGCQPHQLHQPLGHLLAVANQQADDRECFQPVIAVLDADRILVRSRGETQCLSTLEWPNNGRIRGVTLEIVVADGPHLHPVPAGEELLEEGGDIGPTIQLLHLGTRRRAVDSGQDTHPAGNERNNTVIERHHYPLL